MLVHSPLSNDSSTVAIFANVGIVREISTRCQFHRHLISNLSFPFICRADIRFHVARIVQYIFCIFTRSYFTTLPDTPYNREGSWEAHRLSASFGSSDAGAPIVAFLLLVAMPGAPIAAFLLLVAMPGAPIVAFLLLVAMPGVPSSVKKCTSDLSWSRNCEKLFLFVVCAGPRRSGSDLTVCETG